MNETQNSKLTNIARTLRKNMTPEEKRLWYDFLKDFPVMVHRQKVIGPYIVDFYIAQPQIVIELDGAQHGETRQAEKDAERDRYLSSLGCQVLRYPNWMFRQHFRDICDDIWRHAFPNDL